MKTKYLVLGAGVSGLTFVNELNDDNYIVLERESEAGGYCRTIHSNGFIWDYAGHFFHFSDKEIKQFFQSSMQTDQIVTKDKKTYIYYDGLMIDFPFQKNIHQLKKEEFIDCLYDLFNKEEREGYDNFESMLYGKFGESITNKFLKPYNEKLYACDLNELDVNAMGRFFPYAEKEDIINNMRKTDNSSYNSSFIYPKGGAEVFIDVLLKNIPKDKIKYNVEVNRIDLDKRVAYFDGGLIEYDFLINTIPLNKFCDIGGLKNDFDADASFTSNKVLVFNIGFDKKSKFNDHHWLYFPNKDFVFYRVGFYDNILDQDRLSLYIELGFSSTAEIDEGAVFNKVLNDLRRIGIISDHQVVDHCSIMMDPAYVHISKKSEECKERVLSFLQQNGVYSIGRYGLWTYCSIEDSMLQAKDVLKKLNIHK